MILLLVSFEFPFLELELYKKNCRYAEGGNKLHIPIYHSNTTNMWEVFGLLFICSETKEKVELGMKFYRDALISAGCISSTPS